MGPPEVQGTSRPAICHESRIVLCDQLAYYRLIACCGSSLGWELASCVKEVTDVVGAAVLKAAKQAEATERAQRQQDPMASAAGGGGGGGGGGAALVRTRTTSEVVGLIKAELDLDSGLSAKEVRRPAWTRPCTPPSTLELCFKNGCRFTVPCRQ